MAEHNDIGQLGEQAATNYLIKLGYKILAQNYRYYHAEIDIMALKDDILHCIEVKTRSSTQWGKPESFVGKKKESLVIDAAEHFLEERDLYHELHFDIIEVYAHQRWRINHIEEAFYG
ncbi:MAG: putative endonuclease [Parvicella sp.]|jgi:putative endonuclease